MIVGVGEYVIAVIVYVSVWLVILFDRYLQDHGIGSYQKKLIITTKAGIGEKEVKKELLVTGLSYKLMAIDVDKIGGRITFNYLVEGKKESINKLPDHLYNKDWFLSCKID
jgi:hypothetical protein